MLTLQYAKNPIWFGNDRQQINLTVKWFEFNQEHSFTATSFDSEQHGVDLFNRAKSGEFGDIENYFASSELQPKTTGSQNL
jgi:hypothetical protein